MASSKLKYSTGFALPFSGDALLQQFSFINLKNHGTQITAVKPDFAGGGGGASSINAGNVKLFNTGTADAATTVSYAGNGQKYFSTPTTDASQQLSVTRKDGVAKLAVKQTASTSNQSLGNRLSNLTAGQWLLIAGGAAALVLVVALARR